MEILFLQDKSARIHAAAQQFAASPSRPEIYIASDTNNPFLAPADHFFWGKTDDKAFIKECIAKINPKPTMAFIGPEEPLGEGIADLFWDEGIPCIGPVKELAKLETSKAFTRQLMAKYKIPGCPKHRIFSDVKGIREYLRELGDFVVKPDGLTGGKGVKVSGDHLKSVEEGVIYCKELFQSGQHLVIVEEKLDGEEFSFQSFFDGRHVAHTVPIQDHKRALKDDRGLNTGGMGSYSCADHLLPFLTEEQVAQAGEINRLIGEALLEETGLAYKGILYGGFMCTKDGLKVIEYNARFGDPEIMNVLPLLETDFLEICKAIVDGTLDQLEIRFKRKATVCKYIVPASYPGKPTTENAIDVTELEKLSATDKDLRVFYGAVEGYNGQLRLTGSRAVAVVGLGNTLDEAERIAERAASSVKGDVYHRTDIGTAPLIQKRVDHMNRIARQSQSAEKLRPIDHLVRAAG